MNDEHALVARVLQQDMQAFRELIKQNQKLVLHMVGRVVKNDAEREELCQDVFLKVYEKIGEFGFKSKLSTWIATIAYRQALNHLKKNRMLFSEIPDEERFTQKFVELENPETIFEDENLTEYVLKLVDELPVQYKTVLTLYHVESMTYPEICEVMQMPEGTVKNYLFRARNLLKEKVLKLQRKEELL